jgi:hypothetical protein
MWININREYFGVYGINTRIIMAIDTLEKLINGLENRYILTFNKASLANMTAGVLGTRWRGTGNPPPGDVPTSAKTCDGETVGSWNLPPLPSGGVKMYIGELNICQTVLGQFILFDRLSDMGGLLGNTTDEQFVNLDISTPSSQGRCTTDGSGVLWGIDTYTNLGSTSVTATITYTNELNITGRTTTVTIPATMRVGTIYPILPNVDDKRIKSIQKLQLSNTTGSPGNFGITARVRIAEVSIDTTMKNIVGDYATLALPELTGKECLELAMTCNSTAQGILMGNAAIIRN